MRIGGQGKTHKYITTLGTREGGRRALDGRMGRNMDYTVLNEREFVPRAHRVHAAGRWNRSRSPGLMQGVQGAKSLDVTSPLVPPAVNGRRAGVVGRGAAGQSGCETRDSTCACRSSQGGLFRVACGPLRLWHPGLAGQFPFLFLPLLFFLGAIFGWVQDAETRTHNTHTNARTQTHTHQRGERDEQRMCV